MLHIAYKEFCSFFQSSTGALILSIYMGFNGVILWVLDGPFNLLDSGYAQLDGLFMLSPWLFLLLIPGIGMKMVAEEKRSGTLEWLLTKPLTEWDIVLGKWLAGLSLIRLALVPTAVYVITVQQMGNPIGNIDLGSTAGSYLGLLLLGASYLSVSIFISSVTDNAIVALVMSSMICLFMYTGFDQIADMMPVNNHGLFWRQLGISEHYSSISRGVVDSRDIIYFLCLCGIFLAASVTALKRRNWS